MDVRVHCRAAMDVITAKAGIHDKPLGDDVFAMGPGLDTHARSLALMRVVSAFRSLNPI